MKFDIIIPVYNSDLKQLEQSILSCLNQTHRDFTINLIIDGCDKDYSYLTNKYDVNVFLLDKNCGPGAARNYGIKNTSSEFISFIDADDYMSINKLKNSGQHFSNKNIDLVCGNYERLKDDKSIGLFYKNDIAINYQKLMSINFIASGSVSVRRGLVENIISDRGYFFDERFNIAEDYCAWLSIAEHGYLNNKNNIKYIHKKLYTYRTYSSGTSLYSNSENKKNEAKVLSIIREESKRRVDESRQKKEKA